jgi:hypothetical protein
MNDPQFKFQVRKKAILFLSILFIGIFVIAFSTCH